jgi:biopolymer transport protein ExbD
MTSTQLKETLARMKSSDRETSVVVEATDDVDYQRIVDVLDIVYQLQITKVGLVAQTIATKTD